MLRVHLDGSSGEVVSSTGSFRVFVACVPEFLLSGDLRYCEKPNVSVGGLEGEMSTGAERQGRVKRAVQREAKAMFMECERLTKAEGIKRS